MHIRALITIVLLIYISICTPVYAQQDTISRNLSLDYNTKTNINNSLIDSSLKYTKNKGTKELKNDCVQLQDKINALKTQIQQLRRDSISQAKKIDSLSKIQLFDSVTYAERMEEFRKKEAKIGHIDTITIQMIITYMNLKCSESRINILREDFVGISNSKIKSEYKQWDDLLSIYTQTYNSVCDAIRSVKESCEDGFYTKIEYDAEKAIEKIKRLNYAGSFYTNDDCTSPYLNTMIKVALEILEQTKNAPNLYQSSIREQYQRFLKQYP